MDVVYLDNQEAFDKVPHRRLLAKVKACGMTGRVTKWISDRKERVAVNGRRFCCCCCCSSSSSGSIRSLEKAGGTETADRSPSSTPDTPNPSPSRMM